MARKRRTGKRTRLALVVATLALSAVLATAMVPYMGPVVHQAAVVVGPGAPGELAPAVPATMVGDQFYDWSRAVCISSGGVERIWDASH